MVLEKLTYFTYPAQEEKSYTKVGGCLTCAAVILTITYASYELDQMSKGPPETRFVKTGGIAESPHVPTVDVRCLKPEGCWLCVCSRRPRSNTTDALDDRHYCSPSTECLQGSGLLQQGAVREQITLPFVMKANMVNWSYVDSSSGQEIAYVGALNGSISRSEKRAAYLRTVTLPGVNPLAEEQEEALQEAPDFYLASISADYGNDVFIYQEEAFSGQVELGPQKFVSTQDAALTKTYAASLMVKATIKLTEDGTYMTGISQVDGFCDGQLRADAYANAKSGNMLPYPPNATDAFINSIKDDPSRSSVFSTVACISKSYNEVMEMDRHWMEYPGILGGFWTTLTAGLTAIFFAYYFYCVKPSDEEHVNGIERQISNMEGHLKGGLRKTVSFIPGMGAVETKEEAAAIYDALDKDGDGVITKEELEAAMDNADENSALLQRSPMVSYTDIEATTHLQVQITELSTRLDSALAEISTLSKRLEETQAAAVAT